jgi:hypothetical protein
MTNTYDGALFAKGIVLGEITQRSTRMADAIITKDCLSILGADVSRHQLDDTAVPNAVWRSLCANRDQRGKPPPSSYASLMVNVLRASSSSPTLGRRKMILSRDTPVSDIDVEVLLETDLSEEMEEFLRRVRDVIWNRRTFRGERTYDERSGTIVGLAPQHAEVGDRICILYGCSMPVVLRKQSSEDGYYWKLVGEVYVDRYMEGKPIFSLSTAALLSAEVEFEIR